MSVARIANRYAKSLLDLAVDRNEVDVVLSDVEGLQQLLNSRDFYLFLRSPVVQSERKKAILTRIFDGKVSQVMLAFLKRLAIKGRENLLPEVLSAFMDQYRAMKGISIVTLVSASELPVQLTDRIKNVLQSSSETRNKVDLQTKVDPSLIGGFIIDFDDRQYDASVRHNLDEIRKAYA